jgi:hypothetical protein
MCKWMLMGEKSHRRWNMSIVGMTQCILFQMHKYGCGTGSNTDRKNEYEMEYSCIDSVNGKSENKTFISVIPSNGTSLNDPR